MIETIFYFAPDYGTYYSNWESGNISARTICFVPKGEGLGDIYKNGVKYGNTISETQLLEKIQEKIADIPFASTSTAGIVKLGKGLKAVGADGTVDVDFSGINDLSGLDELVEKILKDLIKDGVDGKDGLDALDYKITSFSTTTNGLNLTQGDKFNQTVDLTNVVKGIVSAWFQNPSDPTLPDLSQKDYSITAFGKNGTSLFINQNNNTQKSVDIQDMVKSSIQNLITNGDTIFNSIGSVVAVNPILTSGTRIATITVDGVTKTLYAPTSSEGGGTTPGYDGPTEEEINDMIDQAKQDLQDEIDSARDVANKQKTRLDGLISTLGTEIQTKFEGMLADEEWMREHWPQGQQSSTSNFGQQDVEAYLQTLGVWDENEEHTRSNAKWTKIQQKVDSIEIAVNALSSSGDMTEALQSSINQAVNNGIASLSLETTYAKADETKKVIEWLTSGFRSATSSEMTYNDVVSAANNGDHSAISNLYSKVQRIDNEYVSESGVQSMVDNSISGLASEAYVDHATSQLSSSIGKNAENISAVRTYVDDKTSKASIVAAVGDVEGGLVLKSTHDEAIANLNTKFGDYSTTLVMESKINAATAGLVASQDLDGYVKKASVITSVNEDGSNVKINADKINIADITIQGSQISGIDEIVAGKLDNLTIDATKVTNLAETIDARNANLEVHKLVTEGGNGTLMIDGTNGLYLEGVEAESKINMDGSGYFADGNISWDTTGAVKIKGELSAATGTFSGALNGATGTFSGNLNAASGTFSGSLSGASGTFAGNLTAANGSISGNFDVTGTLTCGNGTKFTSSGMAGLNFATVVNSSSSYRISKNSPLVVNTYHGATLTLPSDAEPGQVIVICNLGNAVISAPSGQYISALNNVVEHNSSIEVGRGLCQWIIYLGSVSAPSAYTGTRKVWAVIATNGN